MTDPEAARAFLTSIMDKPDCHGSVLVEQGVISGYMLGSYAENQFFGRHAWVPYGGTALKDGLASDSLRYLYAAAGEQWIQDKVLNHYLICPAVPVWLQAFFSLSFGQEQAYAAASLREERPVPELPPGIQMREVQPQDAPQLFAKADWIAAFLNTAPVWEPVPGQHLERIRPGYAELAEDLTSTTWVALDGDQIVSYVVIYPVDTGPEHLLGDPAAAHFAAAATHPEYRRLGIGRCLFTHILNIAYEQKFKVIFTDWRTTNLTAARYWPTFGFEPYAYRLLRRVNPRYAPYQP
jgi:ribosomal protein S18 acetylase RimI-like enzyme